MRVVGRLVDVAVKSEGRNPKKGRASRRLPTNEHRADHWADFSTLVLAYTVEPLLPEDTIVIRNSMSC